MKAWFPKEDGAEARAAVEVPAPAPPPSRGPRLDRLLMVLILVLQAVIIVMFIFYSRRQPETLGSLSEAGPPPPTQGALGLPPASSPPAAEPLTALSQESDLRAMEAHFAKLREEMDRRMDELFPGIQSRRTLQAPPGFPPGVDQQISHMMEHALQEFRALESSAQFDEGWTSLLRSPALDMQDRDSYYLVVCSLPGFGKEDLHVTLEGRLLTIRGESSSQSRQPIQRAARYERQVWMPGPVESGDKAQAALINGVLRIMVPKAESMPEETNVTRLM